MCAAWLQAQILKLVSRLFNCFAIFGLSIAILAESAIGQSQRRCADAVSLWLPSGTTSQEKVTKWNKSIKYGIAPEPDDGESLPIIDPVVRFISGESGLQLERDDGNSTLDLAIVVPSDIGAFAANVPSFVQAYFQDIFTKRRLTGSVTIDPARWVPQFRAITPKCGGSNLKLDGVIERAFVMVQRGQSSLCTEIALAEVFGIINVRKYYVEHGRSVPDDLIGLAFRTLYDSRVRPGMNHDEADRVTREICE
jgi:hypothetical protein